MDALTAENERRVVKRFDPELERLIDEEEEIQRNILSERVLGPVNWNNKGNMWWAKSAGEIFTFLITQRRWFRMTYTKRVPVIYQWQVAIQDGPVVHGDADSLLCAIADAKKAATELANA